MPILADHYGRVLDGGEITLERDGGSFVVRYREHSLPLAPRSLDGLLSLAAARCGSDELAFLATSNLRHASTRGLRTVIRGTEN